MVVSLSSLAYSRCFYLCNPNSILRRFPKARGESCVMGYIHESCFWKSLKKSQRRTNSSSPLPGCGTELVLGDLYMIDGTHGDWETENVELHKQRDDRNYIQVSSCELVCDCHVSDRARNDLSTTSLTIQLPASIGHESGNNSSKFITVILHYQNFTEFLCSLAVKLELLFTPLKPFG